MQVKWMLPLLVLIASMRSEAGIAYKVERMNGDIQAGEMEFRPKMRLSDLPLDMIAGIDCSFTGRLYRQDHRLLDEQKRLKRGLKFDLRRLGYEARLRGEAGVAQWADRLYRTVDALAVTGRVGGINLNPLKAASSRRFDPSLQQGDRLAYGRCSAPVITLAQAEFQAIPYTGPIDALEKLPSMENEPWLDPGYIWIVQPTGQISFKRAGYWSRHYPLYVGAGGFFFRPLNPAWSKRINPDFNHDLARFLATQWGGAL